MTKNTLPRRIATLDTVPEAVRGYFAPAPDGAGFVLQLAAAAGDAVDFQAAPRNVRITRAQAADLRNYAAAREQAARQGGTLEIVDDLPAPPPADDASAPKPDPRDVQITAAAARDFGAYARAKADAAAKGGVVRITGYAPAAAGGVVTA